MEDKKLYKPIKKDWEDMLLYSTISEVKWDGDSLVGLILINGHEEHDVFIKGTLGVTVPKEHVGLIEPVETQE